MDASKLGMRIVSSGLLLASLSLVYLRGGLLAWIGLTVAIALLAKHVRRPARTDLVVALAVSALWAASWAAAWGYVRSTWESGEVVDLRVAIEGETHAARVWILDVDDGVALYYDAPPEVARALLAGAPITIDRGGARTTGCANATAVDDLPPEELASLFALMQTKYAERNRATDVFYVVIGVERGRIGVVVRPTRCA